MRSVLFVSDQLPTRQIGMQHAGNARYVASFLEYFAKRGDSVAFVLFDPNVDFISERADRFSFRLIGPSLAERRNRIVVRPFAARLRSLSWRTFERLPLVLRKIIARLRRAARRSRGFSHCLGRYRTNEEQAYVRAVVADLRPDLIIFDGIFNYCETTDAARTWMLTHEIKADRAQSFAAAGYAVLPAGFDRETEAGILSRCEHLIAIQWDDAARLRALCPKADVVVVPASFPPPPHAADRAAVDGRCVFVASASFHNVQGIEWFLRACWPRVTARRPHATLGLYGSIGAQLGPLPSGVTDFGVVEDLSDAYERANVVIVPLRIGSGLKVKIVEAIMHTVPIVTTPVGAQGLEALEPRPFRIADDADAFAQNVCDLLTDEAERARLEASCRRAAKLFSPLGAFADFSRALAS